MSETETHQKDKGEWIVLLKPALEVPGWAQPYRNGVIGYRGDVGGVIVYAGDNIKQPKSLARRSPGLKYGLSHDMLPEVSVDRWPKE